jgi:cell division protein FtsQ
MQPLKTLRRDPAPSRVAYRIHRLWLTPFFRAFLRIGVPAAAVVALGVWYFGNEDNREAIFDKVAEIRSSIEGRPEFMVQLMAIDGASVEIDQDIREIVPVDFPVSSFDLDLEGMRARIEELDAVARVNLQIRSGGVLQVNIRERVPAIVWRSVEGLDLLDVQGHRVASIVRRADRRELPLVTGAGAGDHVAEALAIFAAAAPIGGRVRGLVRIGERRWDVVLDRDQRILLPEENSIDALEQVMALQQAQDLMERDLVIVDMRNKDRPTLRMAAPAVDELRRIKDIRPGADG